MAVSIVPTATAEKSIHMRLCYLIIYVERASTQYYNTAFTQVFVITGYIWKSKHIFYAIQNWKNCIIYDIQFMPLWKTIIFI